MTWPFDQEPNVAAITSKAVMDGAPVLLVSHDADDHAWSFLDGKALDVGAAWLVSMKSVVEVHPDLVEIADLAPGWIATRASVDLPWVRVLNPLA